MLVQLERQRLGTVQHHQFVGEHFHLTRAEVRIRSAGRALAHHAFHLQHELATYPFGLTENFRTVGVEHHLQQAFTVAQVNKNDAAMVTPTPHPTSDGYRLTDERFVDLTAVMGTHGKAPRHRRPAGAAATKKGWKTAV